MALSEARKKILAEQKRRALMKDIAKREAAQEELSLMPFAGINAKRALRIANKANIDGDYEALYASKREDTLDELNERIGNTNRGRDRDLRNIEKYGDDAMRSRSFGSRQTQGMMGGGKVKKPAKKMDGGKMKKPVAMKSGGKMPMVKKGGKSVPSFAADGVGKMSYGGKTPKKMNMGGKCRGMGAATRGGNFKMG